MSIEKVKAYFANHNMEDKILEFETSSATVALAAQALGIDGARIAKSLGFLVGEQAILVVAAGDAKVNNSKFKGEFGTKMKMLTPEQAVSLIGHAVGGVCPFALNEGVAVYLDQSLQRFETVYPACGSSNSAIELTIAQLEAHSNYIKWVDVCKPDKRDA